MADVVRQTNNAALAGWLTVLIVTLATQGVEAAVMILIGYLLQWAKAPKGWRTDVAQAVVAVVCFGVYYAFHHPASWWPLPSTWLHDAAMWTVDALGIASLAGSTKGAPQTDSLS